MYKIFREKKKRHAISNYMNKNKQFIKTRMNESSHSIECVVGCF